MAARLANAEGYDVCAADGQSLGQVDHLRYEKHADHPDSLIIRRGVLFWKRWASIPFEAVQSVDTEGRSVILNVPSLGITALQSGSS